MRTTTRRSLLKNFFSLGVVAALPLSITALPAAQPVDEWQDFLNRLEARVKEIVRREGRSLSTSKLHLPLWIEPPRAAGNVYVRRVHVMLQPGPSLLDKLHHSFEEVSGSRAVDF